MAEYEQHRLHGSGIQDTDGRHEDESISNFDFASRRVSESEPLPEVVASPEERHGKNAGENEENKTERRSMSSMDKDDDMRLTALSIQD